MENQEKEIWNNLRTFGVEIEFIAPNGDGTTKREMNQYFQRLAQDFGTTGLQGDLVSPFSLEVSCASYSNCDSTKWRLKPDQSLSSYGTGFAMELVSPVLQGWNGVQQLQLMLKALEKIGAKVNKSCGLHVHVGVSDWKIKEFRNLFKRYIKFESAIDSVMPNSRRGRNNEYCIPILGITGLKQSFNEIDDCRSARQISSLLRTRYTKLNIKSFWKHGTVEFRHHSGTTDVEKIMNWLKFCLTMCQAADQQRAIKVKDNDNRLDYTDKIALMLKGLSKVKNSLVDSDVRKYFIKRRRQLCTS